MLPRIYNNAKMSLASDASQRNWGVSPLSRRYKTQQTEMHQEIIFVPPAAVEENVGSPPRFCGRHSYSFMVKPPRPSPPRPAPSHPLENPRHAAPCLPYTHMWLYLHKGSLNPPPPLWSGSMTITVGGEARLLGFGTALALCVASVGGEIENITMRIKHPN